jgi:hypothetical protein
MIVQELCLRGARLVAVLARKLPSKIPPKCLVARPRLRLRQTAAAGSPVSTKWILTYPRVVGKLYTDFAG